MLTRSYVICRRSMTRFRRKSDGCTRLWKPRSWVTAACSISRICSAAIRQGRQDVEQLPADGAEGRVRKKGGRKSASSTEEGLLPVIEAIVANHTAGSPVDEGTRWTNRSPRQISEEL